MPAISETASVRVENYLCESCGKGWMRPSSTRAQADRLGDPKVLRHHMCDNCNAQMILNYRYPVTVAICENPSKIGVPSRIVIGEGL